MFARFLHGVIKWQQLMVRLVHQRMDRQEAQVKEVGEFIQDCEEPIRRGSLFVCLFQPPSSHIYSDFFLRSPTTLLHCPLLFPLLQIWRKPLLHLRVPGTAAGALWSALSATSSPTSTGAWTCL